jgi:hypothetical protein
VVFRIAGIRLDEYIGSHGVRTDDVS